MTYTEAITALKQARKSQGITQVALANKLGISKGYLCNIEKGVYIPKMDMLFKMASELGVEIKFEVNVNNKQNGLPENN